MQDAKGRTQRAYGVVHCKDQALDPSRITATEKHQTLSFVNDQIVGALREPNIVKSARTLLHLADHRSEHPIIRRRRQLTRQSQSKSRDLGRSAAQPMIRHSAGERKPVLYAVEAVHFFLRSLGAPPGAASLYSIYNLLAFQEKAVQRQNKTRFIKH